MYTTEFHSFTSYYEFKNTKKKKNKGTGGRKWINPLLPDLTLTRT